MDITETYIKMSDHPLIQGQWTPKIGDWYHRSGEMLYHKGMAIIAQNPKGTIFLVKDKSFKIHYLHWKNHPEHQVCKEIYQKHTWLPTQDRIQGMMGYASSMLNTYAAWGIFQDIKLFGQEIWQIQENLYSPEQLWLAFYMHEKHGLTWDGDKWIK